MKAGLIVCVTFMAASAASASTSPWTRVGGQGVANFVQLSAEATDDDVRLATAELCGMKKPICKVLFWQSPDVAAKKFPMSDAEAESLAADWSQNLNTGHRRLLWDCERFEASGDDCL